MSTDEDKENSDSSRIIVKKSNSEIPCIKSNVCPYESTLNAFHKELRALRNDIVALSGQISKMAERLAKGDVRMESIEKLTQKTEELEAGIAQIRSDIRDLSTKFSIVWAGLGIMGATLITAITIAIIRITSP
jgi:predicted  nucleic acid-binding Zn-ribbon protein